MVNKTGDNCYKSIRKLLTRGKTADSMDVSHEGMSNAGERLKA